MADAVPPLVKGLDVQPRPSEHGLQSFCSLKNVGSEAADDRFLAETPTHGRLTIYVVDTNSVIK